MPLRLLPQAFELGATPATGPPLADWPQNWKQRRGSGHMRGQIRRLHARFPRRKRGRGRASDWHIRSVHLRRKGCRTAWAEVETEAVGFGWPKIAIFRSKKFGVNFYNFSPQITALSTIALSGRKASVLRNASVTARAASSS